MSVTKPAELAMDRARDMRAQSLNPNIGHENDVIREEESHRPQAAEGAEERRVSADDRKGPQRHGSEDENRREENAPNEDQLKRLKQEASEQLLSLPVDTGKFAVREEHRIDIRL